MDDTDGSRVVQRVGRHQAEASQHPASSTSRIPPIADSAVPYSAGTCPQGLSGDRNRVSPLRMLRPMAPPPSPPPLAPPSPQLLPHQRPHPLGRQTDRTLRPPKCLAPSLHLECICSCWGPWHLSQFWHHSCLHQAEKDTRRISLAGQNDDAHWVGKEERRLC